MNKEVVIEGSAAVKSGVKAGAKLKSLFFSGSETLQKFDKELLVDVPLYKIKYDIVKSCTQSDMPEGVLGIKFIIPLFWLWLK